MRGLLSGLMLLTCLAVNGQQATPTNDAATFAGSLKDRFVAKPGNRALFDSAVLMARTALQTNCDHNCRLGIYQTLEALFAANKNYSEALAWKKKYIALTDSLGTKEQERKMAQHAVQFQYNRKAIADSMEAANRQLYRQQRLNRQITWSVLGGGGTLLLLTFAFLALRNNKRLKRERERTEELLHNILPRSVADELKQKGATTAAHYNEVTVLFVNLGVIANDHSLLNNPQTVVNELHNCFKTFDAIMQQHGIEKIKTIGDTYLAVAGLPDPSADTADTIVKAAVEIRRFMAGRSKAGDRHQLRIGIHTGPVVAGVVGIKKFAYDIWGDTVNTAARLQQNCEPGKINISERTWHIIANKYNVTYRGELPAKNKGVLKMYYVE